METQSELSALRMLVRAMYAKLHETNPKAAQEIEAQLDAKAESILEEDPRLAANIYGLCDIQSLPD